MSRLVNVEDYRRRAGRRLPKIIFDYLEGGALDEHTLRANTDELQQLRLRQSILRDVSAVDLTTTVLGHTISTPVMISPMGLLTVFCRDADVAMARAARDAGTIFVHSAWSGTPLQSVTAAAPGAVWAQLSLWKDANLVHQHIERAQAAGVDVLVIAGDVSTSSKRERDLHNGFGATARPTISSVLNALHKPRWLANFTFGPKVSFGDQSINGKPMSLRQMERFMHDENDRVTWQDIKQIRERWSGKLAIKGVMSAADAQAARDAGVDAIFISNHGGRQFDAQPSTTHALQEIVDVIGGEIEILIDGGIRRGSDIIKLTALGASACLIGRPAVYGVVTAGQPGVSTILRTLAEEAATALAFTGATHLDDLKPDVIVGATTGRSAGPPSQTPASVSEPAPSSDRSLTDRQRSESESASTRTPNTPAEAVHAR